MTYIRDALRKLVFERADGRCEYCLVPEDIFFSRHQIDHIVAEKHGGQTAEENLALSCTLCNMYKGSDIASIDEQTVEIVRLFNPRVDFWTDHYLLDTGFLIGLTPNARATIRLLRLNMAIRVEQRRRLIT